MTSPVGRPRSDSIDRDILEAVAALGVESGYSGLTVSKIVERAGTSKPAFYRRFDDIAETIPYLLSANFGVDISLDTGSLPGDFLEFQLRQVALLASPLCRRLMPGYLDAIATRPDRQQALAERYLKPCREYSASAIERAYQRGEIREMYDDPGYLVDLLSGPVLKRAMFPEVPPIDHHLVRKTVNSLLNEVGYTGDRSALDHIVLESGSSGNDADRPR